MDLSQRLLQEARIDQAVAEGQVARLMVDGHHILSADTVPGLDLDTKETKTGVRIVGRLHQGVVLKEEVHFCFGMLEKKGRQTVVLDLDLEPRSAMKVVGHCIFSAGFPVYHQMQAKINVGQKAKYQYLEEHVHDEVGRIEIVPEGRITVAAGAEFRTEFVLLQGRAGKVRINYAAEGQAESLIDLVAKINGYGRDDIVVRETAALLGKNARGGLRSRIAVRDLAKAEVYNSLTASAAGTKGHIDCTEILRDRGQVRAYPVAQALHPQARITHEARLGGVDNKQLETLMARGLSRRAAEDLIIKGLLG